MKKIAIVVGHTPMDGGAFNETHQMSEFDFNNRLAPILAAKLRVLGYIPQIVYRNTYTTLPTDVNITGAHACISLHCNAFNGQPNGCEVLYFIGSEKSKDFASKVLARIPAVMGNKNRGVKGVAYDYQGSKGDRGGLLLQKTNMPAIIVEPFFLDSDEMLEKGLKHMDDLAEAYAQGIRDFIK